MLAIAVESEQVAYADAKEQSQLACGPYAWHVRTVLKPLDLS
jgi:hypothetical protein